MYTFLICGATANGQFTPVRYLKLRALYSIVFSRAHPDSYLSGPLYSNLSISQVGTLFPAALGWVGTKQNRNTHDNMRFPLRHRFPYLVHSSLY